MKNLFAFIFAVGIILLSFVASLLLFPEADSIMFFFIGLLFAVLGIRVANWVIKSMSRNPKLIFLIFTLTLIALAANVIYLYECNILNIIVTLDIGTGWIGGIIIGALIQIFHCFMYLTNRV